MALQPRRFTTAPSAVGCKRLWGGHASNVFICDTPRRYRACEKAGVMTRAMASTVNVGDNVREKILSPNEEAGSHSDGHEVGQHRTYAPMREMQ